MARAITSQSRNHRVALRYIEIFNSGDPSDLKDVLAEDFVQVTPQSGEVVRGIKDFSEVMRNWPAGEDQTRPRVVAQHVVPSETQDLIKPQFDLFFPVFNVISLEGEGDTLTAYGLTSYPDGSEWYVVSVLTFRAEKITQEVHFFGPRFEPAPWRSQWVSVLSPAEQLELLELAAD